MSSFTDPLVVTPNEDGSLWTLKEPFRYWTVSEGKGDLIVIPAGFQTDFASIPRVFWTILPPYGDYGKAAIVHDYLYSNRGKVGDKTYTRKECDEIFLFAMKSLSVGWLKRYVIYFAVRGFAGFAWESEGI